MPRRLVLNLSIVILLAGCDGPPPPTAPPGEANLELFAGGSVIVGPSQSIQAALNSARSGDQILLRPGVYREAVTIDQPGIRLAGLGDRPGDVVIRNPGGAENGITVTRRGDGVAISNLTVLNFGQNGVFLTGVDGFTLSKITARNNGEYGLFPVFSTHGVIANCTASGHEDTGIYVGQSKDVTIRRSVAFNNVNGIEIENSSHIRVTGNETFNNVAGILVVLLPGLAVKYSADIELTNNTVRDNNAPNQAGSGFERFVPSGSGILIVGTDRTMASHNRVVRNKFVGIGVASTGLLAQLAGIPIDDIEPFPDRLRVLDNQVTSNGGAQPIPSLPPGVDLLWDGSGSNDCWIRNRFGSSLNLNLAGGAPSPTLPACRI